MRQQSATVCDKSAAFCFFLSFNLQIEVLQQVYTETSAKLTQTSQHSRTLLRDLEVSKASKARGSRASLALIALIAHATPKSRGGARG